MRVARALLADSVRFYFDFVSKDTLAQGAQLRIELAAPRARCRACGAERELSAESALAGEWYLELQSLAPCECGEQAHELAGGFECWLESIEVE